MPQVATWVTASRHGGLWTAGPHLGAFDLETARTVTVVSLPRNELVVCAAWSADGSLLAAAGTRGSVSLWQRDGNLVAHHFGSGAPPYCEPDDFHFSTRAQRVLWSPIEGHAALLGPGQALEVVRGQATLTQDGSRALIVDDARTTLLDGASGKVLLSLEGPYGQPAVSDGERLAALITHEGRVHVHDLSSGTLLGSVPGHSAAFHGERLLVHVSEKNHEFATTIAYGLRPLAELWRAPGVSVLDDGGAAETSDEVAAWGVGIDVRRGYSVVDLRTGRALASWRASGYACGYEWLWQRGTLVFAEGNLLTFWSKRGGARTVHADCDTPRLNTDRSAVLVANGVWHLETRTRSGPADLPEGGVYAFGRAARVLHGDFTSGKELEPRRAAWDMTTGKRLWDLPAKDDEVIVDVAKPWWRARKERAVSMALVDERDGSLIRLAHVVSANGAAETVIFDEECWAGPTSLPSAVRELPAFPTKHCPELVDEWRELTHGEASH